MEKTHQLGKESIGVCWLPQYHDYGLVSNYSAALCIGFTLVCFSPFSFIRDPLLWPRTIQKYKCSITCGPNFAYSLIHKKWLETNKPCFDLSSVENASIAAEPIQIDTVQKMKDMGFRFIRPSYGLAENVVFVNTTNTNIPQIKDSRVACCTNEYESKRILIHDEEIYVQGDDLASGYWNQPELTKETFHVKLEGYDGEWLRTGDLGFIHDGLLYVTGRKKELIKIRGKNVFPTDIETDIESEFKDFLRPGCSAVFQHTDASVGFVGEYRDGKNAPDEALIQQSILKNHGVDCTYIKLGPKGSTPKTTSGKIKRVECQKLSQGSAPVAMTQTLDVDEIVKAIETGESKTLDMDKTLVENGVDSIKQVQVEQALASSRTLTEKHKELLRSGSSLRNIKDEIMNTSTRRIRNIETGKDPTFVHQSTHISVYMRGFLMCLVNMLNIIIPLAIAGALYEISILWGAILVWMVMYTFVVMICVRIFNFKGVDSFEISVNTLAYIRWYFCRNMMAIWNVFVGTWIVGTVPYNIFLMGLGARVSLTSVIETLFEYVDGRLEVRHGVQLTGICDTAAHRTSDTLYFSRIFFDEKSKLKGDARIWPGAKLGKRSVVDNWSYLHVNETMELEGHKVKGSPSYAEPFNQSIQDTHSLLIHFARLVVIPAYVIGGYFASSFVFTSVENPFLYFVGVFLFAQFIFALSSPLIKHVFVCISPYIVDQLCSFGVFSMYTWIYPSGGPLWNIYLKLFGTRISMDTFVANGMIGSPSEASMVTVKNNSFVSFGVRFENGSKPVVIDNSEVAYGAVVPEKGIECEQVLRHGVKHVRVEGKDDGRLIFRMMVSIFVSITIVSCYVSSVYPAYMLGELMCRQIHSRILTVLCVFTPLVMIQVLIIHPLVLRILSLVFRMIRIPYMSWFMGFWVFRIYGASVFFAGSPLYNLSLNINGSSVAFTALVYCTLRDDDHITIKEGSVVDMYPSVMGHLYSQRKFHEYKTVLEKNTLYEGPGLWIGTPVEKH